MDETPKSKQRYRLKKNKVPENKSNLKEWTPMKAISPQGHSTPLDSEKTPSTSTTTKAGYKDACEDEDDDQSSPFQFFCTQDTLAVGWDCGSPQQKSSKTLGSKVKRKLGKGNEFAQKKQSLKSCSPVQPLRPRRRFNIEKPSSDFSELIPELQVVADLVKKTNGQNGETAQSSSCGESNMANGGEENVTVSFLMKREGSSSNKEEDLAVDVPKNEQVLCANDTMKIKEQCVVTLNPDVDLLKRSQCDVGSETFTALFDDDEDEYMVKCSQEVEEKLNKNIPVVCSGNSDLSLSDYKNSDHVPVESKSRSSKIDNPRRNSPFHLKHNNISSKKPDSPKVGTKYYVRIKSGTPKYSKDEHCHSRSSLNRSSASVQICYGRANTEQAIMNSKPPTASEIAFDDSFDAVIQNLSEKDIEMLSQGHAEKVTGTEIGKQSFHKVEDRTQMNWKKENVLKLTVGQSPPIHTLSVHHINSKRQLKQVNQGSAVNEICAPRMNKMQFQLKVPSEMCNNRSLSNRPSTVSPVQLNKPHFSKGGPLVNNKVYVMQQEQSNSATKKNSNTVQLRSSTNSNSLASNAVPNSSPQKYTPDEIQKKRLEAKKKLEKKKLAMLYGNDKQCHLSKDP